MIILIDNYDSFTFNLFHYLGSLGADVVVHRNDKISVDDVMAANPEAIVLSPGPATPDEAGICLDLIKAAAATIPIMGVCLGHQAIGQAFGGKVVRATPIHGKVSEIRHSGTGVFHGINGPLKATRYHSLVVERASMPADLTITRPSSVSTTRGTRSPRRSPCGRAKPPLAASSSRRASVSSSSACSRSPSSASR